MSERPRGFGLRNKAIGKTVTPAKHALSNAEGTQSAPSDGLRPVIPRECEGSKKDFSRSLP